MLSLINKISEVKVVAQTTEAYILCFTETWVTKEGVNSLKLTDFAIVSCYCRSLHRHGGAIIYVRNKYVCCWQVGCMCEISVKSA